MRLPALPTVAVTNRLNDAYFHSVWNATDDRGQANFALSKAADRLKVGAVPVDQAVVGLPTTDQVYAVYHCAQHLFGRFLAFPAYSWISDSDLMTQFGVSIQTYTAGGRLIPRGYVQFRYNPVKSQVLVAIRQVYSFGCTGISYPNLFMSVCLDTSRLTPVVAQTLVITTSITNTITPAMVTQAILQAYTSYPKGTYVVVNGWIYDRTAIPVLKTGDIIEIVSDPDILGYCDITVDDNQTGYNSIMYSGYREILHVPKALNPNQYVFTNDTVFAVVMDTVTKKGVYGHRADPHAIESITHQDFSMSRQAIQAFQNSLSSQGVFVRLYVRQSTNPHVLTDEVNHINDLYALSDSDISKQLAGLATSQIAVWKASHLEASLYLTLLYQFRGFASSTVLDAYTQAMGYHSVASVLGQMMHFYSYTGSAVQIAKPARLVGYVCEVIVYVDGRKLPRYAFDVIENSNTQFTLGFKITTHIRVGARVAVYIAEGGERSPILFTPTPQARTIIVDNDDYGVYVMKAYTDPQPVWKSSVQTGYQLLPAGGGNYSVALNTNGTVTYQIALNHVAEQILLVPKCGLATLSYPLDTLLASGQPLLFDVTIKDTLGNNRPILGTNAVEVYLNGYRLVDMIDYRFDPILGTNNDVLQTLLVVTNQDYLDLLQTGNILEVVLHGDTVISSDDGYVISNTMIRDHPPVIWSPSCGRAFVHGKLIENVTETGTHLVSADPVADGAVYYLEWNLAYGAQKLLTNEPQQSDITLRTQIDTLLNQAPVTLPTTVLVDHLYALYSAYIAAIVRDVSSGQLVIADDPKDDRFLAQFNDYVVLLSRDPTLLTGNPHIDRRFVTLAAHYVNFAVQDSVQMRLVQRLITLLLTPAVLSINEVLI